MTIERVRIAFAVAGAATITPFAISAVWTAIDLLNRF